MRSHFGVVRGNLADLRAHFSDARRAEETGQQCAFQQQTGENFRPCFITLITKMISHDGTSPRDEKKVVVALVGCCQQSSDESVFGVGNEYKNDCRPIALHYRNDPCTRESRLYGVFGAQPLLRNSSEDKSRNRLCELSMLAPLGVDDGHSYSSFMIKSESAATVVGNSNLYTLTDVDPLFFLLPMELDENTSSTGVTGHGSDEMTNNPLHKWQPLDQILSTLDPILKSCVDPAQVLHLFAIMQLGPGEVFYKFSKGRALTWLTKKQRSVNQFLVEHRKREKESKDSKYSSSLSGGGPGAFAEGFYVPADSRTQQLPVESTKVTDVTNLSRLAKEESIQIICGYLSHEWRALFLDHLNESEDVLQNHRARATKRAQTEVASSTATMSTVPSNADSLHKLPLEKKAKKETAMPAGIKKLAAVNTKGMKKMSSFFSVSSRDKKGKRKS